MYIILLSGGSGKRLWPLSNDLRSKQYIKVINNTDNSLCSMVQRVWQQLEAAGLDKNRIITATKGQVEIIKSQLGADIDIAIEPERRDTFAAIALSSAYLKSKLGADDDDAVVVLPVDPYTDMEYFYTLKTLEDKLLTSESEFVLMGAKPTSPSEKFGYIVPFENSSRVSCFVEKPKADRAGELIKAGALWNCGVFCFRLKTILDRISVLGLSADYDKLYTDYAQLPKTSFDYGVLEKSDSISVVRFNGGWSDLGTWNTLAEQMPCPDIGNVVMHPSCENTNIINELDIPVVAMGTKDMIITAAFDGILVSDKETSTKIKDCVGSFTYPPKFEERRWGTIKVIDTEEKDGILNTTRKIHIFPQMNSSYHFHRDRDEVWTIITGNAEVVINGIRQLLTTGDVIRIPQGVKHAVKSLDGITFIEVQIGRTIADKDINRITLNWEEIESI